MLAPWTKWNLGQSIEGRALAATVFAPRNNRLPLPAGPGKKPWPWLLCLGGVHGDEIEGVWLMRAAVARWADRYPGERLGAAVWPEVNPDGVSRNQRWNARSIDLNRNLPTKDWTPEVKNPRYPPGPSPTSEPENQALVHLVEGCQPVAILSAHSFSHFQINVNGRAKEWGERLAKINGYPVTEDIGYPTPGCLGTYAGKERGIPTITLEIERGLSEEKVLALHGEVLEESLRYWSEKEFT